VFRSRITWSQHVPVRRKNRSSRRASDTTRSSASRAASAAQPSITAMNNCSNSQADIGDSFLSAILEPFKTQNRASPAAANSSWWNSSNEASQSTCQPRHPSTAPLQQHTDLPQSGAASASSSSAGSRPATRKTWASLAAAGSAQWGRSYDASRNT
jgi:hypothetical protein